MIRDNDSVRIEKRGDVCSLFFKIMDKYVDRVGVTYSLGLDVNFKTTRNGESESREVIDGVVENYRNLCAIAGLDYRGVVKCGQRHTDNIVLIDEDIGGICINDERFEGVDGMITNRKGVVLATINADCILMGIYDPVLGVIANVHSGWRGTMQRIGVKCIEKMTCVYGCDVRDLVVVMSPSIYGCCFEVGDDVLDLFREEFRDIDEGEFIINRDGKWYIDTVNINRILFLRMGIGKENIVSSGICSKCNSDMVHSYRNEGKSYKAESLIIGLK